MGAVLETEALRQSSSTWRMISEPDPNRGKWEDFSAMRLSVQWLRHGRNPNIRTDTSTARSPFVIDQGSGDIDTYSREVDFLFATRLLDETSTNCIGLSHMVDSDTGDTVLVGKIESGRRTIPAVIIGKEVDGRREVSHTLIPKLPTP